MRSADLQGSLLSVNLAMPRTLVDRGRRVPTGIFKEPSGVRVRVTALSLEGDFQIDRRYHGGPDKAIYLYPSEHYAHWAQALERDLAAGFFGENFTTRGLLEEHVRTGDVFRVGTAAVAVTQPRTPCFKLGLKVGSARFIKTFLESGRLGFYLRVVEEGEVGAGDAIERISTHPDSPTIAEVIREKWKVTSDV
jgi:MOSC domain-containing protein YiiM